MGTLGSGNYGLNVINVNGETDSLPICRLVTSVASPIDAPVIWSNASDEYGMAIPAQPPNAGYWTAIRTPVAGLYEIEFLCSYTGQAAPGIFDVYLYVDKQLNFTAATGMISTGTSNAYVGSTFRQSVAASATENVYLRTVLALEKDCFISAYTGSSSGTSPRVNPQDSATLSVRCISLDPASKLPYQTS